MPKRYIKTFTCIDCGRETTRRRTSGDPLICIPCAVIRSNEYNRAMFARNGPAWEAHQRNPGGRPKRSPPRE